MGWREGGEAGTVGRECARNMKGGRRGGGGGGRGGGGGGGQVVEEEYMADVSRAQ